VRDVSITTAVAAGVRANDATVHEYDQLGLQKAYAACRHHGCQSHEIILLTIAATLMPLNRCVGRTDGTRETATLPSGYRFRSDASVFVLRHQSRHQALWLAARLATMIITYANQEGQQVIMVTPPCVPQSDIETIATLYGDFKQSAFRGPPDMNRT